MMADLSERLGLEPARDVASEVLWEDHNGSDERADEAVVADRRATVEAVARWLEGPEAEREVGTVGGIAAEAIREHVIQARADG
jgi:hypothetical protein